VARQESEHASERRVRAYVQKAENGRWQTANRPFGYTMTGEPLEPEATAYRTAVADVLAGKSIKPVAREWNTAGLRTTLAGTTYKGKAVSGEWNSPGVRRLLVNPRYAALKMHRGRVAARALVSNAAPDGNLLILDRRSVIAASGPIRLARSEDAFFTSGVIAIRVTWRFGWQVMHPKRIVKLTVSWPGSGHRHSSGTPPE